MTGYAVEPTPAVCDRAFLGDIAPASKVENNNKADRTPNREIDRWRVPTRRDGDEKNLSIQMQGNKPPDNRERVFTGQPGRTCYGLAPWYLVNPSRERLGALYSYPIFMNLNDLAKEIVATYRRHGWELRRALLRPERRSEISGDSLEGIRIDEAPIDALWFSRASHSNREAWELRLLAESPYALFENFEADETEDLREESRVEMENRMREHVGY